MHWSSDIFTALALSTWRCSDLSEDMRYWVHDRIKAFPEFYPNFDRNTVIQAASDIFFCNIQVYTSHLKYHTFRPRQLENLNLGDCQHTIAIWILSDDNFGSLVNEESALSEQSRQHSITISLDEKVID